MGRIIRNLMLGVDEDLREKLELLAPGFAQFRIVKKSVDARKRSSPHFVYSVELFAPGEEPTSEVAELEPVNFKGEPPLIVGAGPAGLFAALRLVERGVPCHLFEQGSPAAERMKSINSYWRYGELDTRNNVCFGEGGAGLYSDGKLMTRIKSPHIPYVMDRLVRFGAPEEIRYLANPHVGSDRIRRVIPVLREFLLKRGCQIHFNTKITELCFDRSGAVSGLISETGACFNSSHIVLATGHSATEILLRLHQQGVFMEGKSFALGLRVEHPQEAINKIQYRDFAEDLGAANYRLTHHDADAGIGVYSFCMCPGGYVLSSGTESDGVVSNGMSNYHRNSPFANAAIVVSLDHQKLFGNEVLAGLNLRSSLERQALGQVRALGGTKQLPAQRLIDFIEQRSGPVLKSSCPSGVVPVRLDQLLPEWLSQRLREGFANFEKSMRGFLSPEAQLHGVESRTSCPVRITRDPVNFESISHPGLYPAGEGAGYAGGITSAACDGVRIAEAIMKGH